MPLLAIPAAGLSLGSQAKASLTPGGTPDVIRLTLDDNVIEDMIKCVRSGKSINLSLGKRPSLQYGPQTQNFSSSVDPFTTDLYRSVPPSKMNGNKSSPPVDFFANVRAEQFTPTTVTSTAAAAEAVPAPKITSADAAVAALQNSLASQQAKKKDNTIKYIKNGEGLPPPVQQRGPAPKATTKSRLIAQQKNAARSMSSSPNLIGVGSPAVSASIPLSQQKAEKTKAVRRPIIHELALGPATESELFEKADCSKEEFQEALDKVADFEDGKWKLRNKAYKDLDVWSYSYDSEEDRTAAIENAVRVYDKMRLNASEPEWDRLLHKSERGKGKSLSKLQAKIAEGPKLKARDESEQESDTGKPKAEPMARSSSQQSKPKKLSEKDAQAKRLLSKPGKVPKTVAAPKPKERKTTKDEGKYKSAAYISDSDDEPAYTLSAPLPPKPAKVEKVEKVEKIKPAVNKRPREEDASDSGVHSLKKAKKMDSGHNSSSINSRESSQLPRVNHSSASVKKGNSPQKSSPLASSPPTNASDINDSYNTSSSTSPLITQSKAASTLKRSGNTHAEQPVKRHQKNASSTSSLSSVGSYAIRKPSMETLDLARKFKAYYVTYSALHRELSASPEPAAHKLEELLDMHQRLGSMKKKIIEAIQ